MLIGCVADVHIGNHAILGGDYNVGMNRRCWQTVEVFEAAVQDAIDRCCDAFIVAGDLFDNPKPLPPMIAAVQAALEQASRCMRVIVMVGNHDLVSVDPIHHGLGPLWQCADIVDSPASFALGNVQIDCVPFYPGDAKRWLLKHTIKHSGNGRRVLFTHAGIGTDRTPKYLRTDDHVHLEQLRDLADDCNYDLIAAGHWHDYNRWLHGECTIVQCGALVPTGWDNPGDVFGSLLLYDTDARTLDAVSLPGPRFVQCTVADSVSVTARLRDMQEQGQQVYLRIVAKIDERAAAKQMLDNALSTELAVAGQVVPDRDESREVSGKAAAAARNAGAMSDKLAAWIDAMETDADRSAVLAKAKAYLNG